MKPSGWLLLAAIAFAAIGLFAWWPALILGAALGFGAWKQRESERKAAIRARYPQPR